MIAGYARIRIFEQIRAVTFIIAYLIVFQTVVLRVPLADALTVSIGIALVIFGLAFFLEGLLLGLMPLGELVGLKLPSKSGIIVILVFGLMIGFGATLAEPAFAALRTAGKDVAAWNAPLLYLLLERHSDMLILAIGIGVGTAVAFGMIRFYYGLSIKPFIFAIIPLLLAVSAAASFDENMKTILGLAWDSGAVTTGPVTVPLVLALGIGVSRSAGKGEKGGGGFGIVMLASAFPVLSVLIFAAAVNMNAPPPVTEEYFFSPDNREHALKIFEDEEELLRYAFTKGSEAGQQSFFGGTLLSDREYSRIPDAGSIDNLTGPPGSFSPSDQNSSFSEVIPEEWTSALRAVVPLTALLLLVLMFFLRDRPRYVDQVIFGILLALGGMTLLTSGIRLGLAPLGDNVGRQLPRAFRTTEQDLGRIMIEDFDPGIVFESIAPDGTRRSYFYLHEKDEIRRIEFHSGQYDAQTHHYEHIVSRPPLFGPELSLLGIALVFLFAFGLGYGSTLAEPALNALGKTVEDLTVGTIKRSGIIRAVSIGVGLGLMAGVARILFDIPITWLILPVYALLLLLTIWSSEDFTGISWDSGGVTTGPVTVPLVLAMGLGIGGELNVLEGFGVLALASAFPILSVMMYGLYIRSRQRRSILIAREEDTNE